MWPDLHQSHNNKQTQHSWSVMYLLNTPRSHKTASETVFWMPGWTILSCKTSSKLLLQQWFRRVTSWICIIDKRFRNVDVGHSVFDLLWWSSCNTFYWASACRVPYPVGFPDKPGNWFSQSHIVTLSPQNITFGMMFDTNSGHTMAVLS